MQTPTPITWRRRSQLRKSLCTGVAIIMGLVLTVPLSGQTVNRMIGIKAGAITTGVNSQVPAFLNTDWRSGVSVGGFVSIDPTTALTLRADLLFNGRGFGFRMYEEGVGLIPGQAKVRSLELQMDVGLRLPWPHQSASVRLFAGPGVGFELSCEVSGSLLGMSFNEACDETVLGLQTRTLDLGLSAGAGIDLHFLPVTVVMDGRFTHGVRNLIRDPHGSESLRSQAWSFTVGLGWPF